MMVWPNTETALSKKWVEKQRDLDCTRLEGRDPLIDGPKRLDSYLTLSNDKVSLKAITKICQSDSFVPSLIFSKH